MVTAVTEKHKFWLRGPEDVFVQVEGAEERDRLAGDPAWTEADPPGPRDLVWLKHDVTGAVVAFRAETLDGWHALGWEFVVPPTARADYGHQVLPVPDRAAELEPEPLAEPEIEARPAVELVEEPETETAEEPAEVKPRRTVKEKSNA